MVTTVSRPGPVIVDEGERPGLAEAEALLQERTGQMFLTDEHGNRVELPETAVRLMHQLVHGLARGNPVEVNALPKEFTVRRAADLLDVPVTEIVRLLDAGEISAIVSGGYRRIRFEDLMEHKSRRDAERREALNEITRLGQEMGGYDPRDSFRNQDSADGNDAQLDRTP